MITFSNKTSNGNFNYTNDELGIAINGSYSLNVDNELININFSFGAINGQMNNSLSGYSNNGVMQFSINCSDFTLLNKVMSVYDDIVAAIKENNSGEDSE